MNGLDRRDVLRRMAGLAGASAAAAGLAVWLSGRSRRPEEVGGILFEKDHAVPPDPTRPDLAVIQGQDLRQLARRAVDELGGIGRFVARGDVVVVKPNMAWDRTPAQGANTNPQLVGELVRVCQEAGARRVIVADVSINEPNRVAARSGIAEAVHNTGAELVLPEARLFREVNLRGETLASWPVLRPFLEADKIINVPVA